MPFYLVKDKESGAKRLVEADKPQGALNHVIGTRFDCDRVDGRELLDAAKECEVEVAGGPLPEPDEADKLIAAQEKEPAENQPGE